MAHSLTATYRTRRGAELAVEKLVQEHKVDRKAIAVRAEGTANSAGEVASGADKKSGPSGDDAPKLDGRVEVVVTIASIDAETLKEALKAAGADDIR